MAVSETPVDKSFSLPPRRAGQPTAYVIAVLPVSASRYVEPVHPGDAGCGGLTVADGFRWTVGASRSFRAHSEGARHCSAVALLSMFLVSPAADAVDSRLPNAPQQTITNSFLGGRGHYHKPQSPTRPANLPSGVSAARQLALAYQLDGMSRRVAL